MCPAAGLLLLAPPAIEADALFPRHPAPSPDGREIAFSWQGDLWIVPASGGVARRLTAHSAYDRGPVWSPDARAIAFTSDRNGNDDVYVLPLAGDPVRQLTFDSGADVALDWAPDGGSVLFSSYRDLVELTSPSVYRVPSEGGTPVRAIPSVGDGATALDGGAIAFTRGEGPWWRRGYRGAAARRLWLWEPARDSVRRLFDSPAQELFPSWSSLLNGVVFLSESDGAYNVWTVDLDGNALQLTRFADDGARYPRVSRQSDLVAFEKDLEIWTVRPGLDPAPIAVVAPEDSPEDPILRLDVTKADEFTVSPDGKQMAFVLRGEIFVRRPDEDASEVVRLTENPARDHQIAWSADSRSLAFISDRDGQQDVYVIRSADEDESALLYCRHREITRLTDTPQDEWQPMFSPYGDRLAFIRGGGDLVVARADGSQERVLCRNFETVHVAWSPDGRWLAYVQPDGDYNHDVFVVSADGGEPVNITRHPDVEDSPVWSADGRKLGFAGRRRYDGDLDIWYVWLRKTDDEKTVQEVLDEDERKPKDGKDKKKNGKAEGGKDEETKESVVVEIDFDQIHRRLHRVSSFPGDEGEAVISPDGKHFVFTAKTEGKTDLWKIRWDGEERERLTEGGEDASSLSWHEKLDRVFYLASGGAMRSVDLKGKKTTYAVEGRVRIDRAGERKQIFEESWRALDEGFYDAGFHGADWPAARERFRPYAEAARHPADFRDAIRLMLGELNASHTDVLDPEREETGVETGHLGVTVVPAPDGGVRVLEVLPESPASRETSRLQRGDVILAVDGERLDPTDSFFSFFDGTTGRDVLLDVRSASGRRREVVIRPESRRDFRTRVYERDVRWRRALTDSLSGGRLGYINLRSMSAPNVDQFERELFEVAAGKDGLVIDVRDNVGGWVTDILLTSLLAGDHAVAIPRGGGPGYPTTRRLLYAWTKPIVVVCNGQTFSNGEIFSWAIQTLGRGKLVGEPTFGGVISTGERRLLDGSQVREPGRGWWANRGSTPAERIRMEGSGCVPDVTVEAAPDDYPRRRDPQLSTAVGVLLDELR